MEDDGDGRLIVEDEVKWEVREAGDNPEAPELCPRLMVARKSLTRCKGVEESFEGENDPCLPKEQGETYENESFEAPSCPGSINATKSPDSLRISKRATSPGAASSKASQGETESLTPHSPATPHTDKGSSCRSSVSSAGGVESGQVDAGGFDDISASMSVIRMEKFALEKRRVSRILPKCLHRTFVDKDVEQLFQTYHERQRRTDLHILLGAGVTFTAYSAAMCVLGGVGPLLPAPLALAGIGVLMLLLMLLCRLHVFPERSWTFLPYLAWALFLSAVGVFVFLGPPTPVPRQALLWLILLHFMLFVGLPLRLPACLLLTSFTAAAHLASSALLMPEGQRLTLQVCASLVLLSAATLLGLMSYFFADKKHRRAFLETRQSLEVKMVIEEQSKEQERLLLSVLPQHVAETMRQDLGRGGDGQFKKIYMSRHENVRLF
uniref:Adenylate cyclase N-terminal domain-containing protein n=1 Tax=Scylla olivacea TaxID=85551 RepID=A0A0P4W939_SCYOL